MSEKKDDSRMQLANPYFQILKSTPLEELKAVLIEGIHIATGAKFMHIANDDPENLFCLSFKTIPMSSNGVAHILEHTVLCGSEKYPIKDPFFAMTRRSLNTFMNALTSADFTCYPAATLLEKDFYNLLEVYLDAVFHPRLNHLSFLQEGIRLEFKKPSDPTSGLQYKGIVFNEMKGDLSSAGSRSIERINKELYPNSTYGVNSGGDPKEIPNLTYQELKDFHEKFYHPSQCLFYFYGNLPLENHLNFIHEKLLKDTTRRPHIPEIAPIPRLTEPRRVIDYYPLSPDEPLEGKAIVSIGWLTTSILDTLDTLAMTILVYYMMDNDSSVLKRALLDSNLCKEVTANFDKEITDVPFILNLKGCIQKNAGKIEKLVFDSLKKIVSDGIPLSKIEAVLHQKELTRSEIGGFRYPFGLSLFMRSALLEQHGVNAEEGLLVHELFDKLRKKIASEPNYLTSIIQKYLIDNQHWVRLIMAPSHEIEKAEIEDELLRLKKIEESLTEQEKNLIVKQAEELAKFQAIQEEEDSEFLPKVTLEDVPKDGISIELNEYEVGNLKVFSHACFTNQLLYADLYFDLPLLQESELPYFRLMAHMLSQLGSGGKNYRETLEKEQEVSGGIWSAISFTQKVTEEDQFIPSIIIKGKALFRNREKFFKLLKEKAEKIDFDDKLRIKELVEKHFLSLSGSLQRGSLGYALSMAASSLTSLSKMNEICFGITYYEFLKKIKDDIDGLIPILKNLHERIFHFATPKLILVADEQFIQDGLKAGFWGLSDFPTNKGQTFPWTFPLESMKSQGRIITSHVATNVASFKTINFAHDDSASISLAANLFDNLVLHSKIREQGGAYSVGCSFSSASGYFSFYSARDPHIASTYDAFQLALDTVSKGDFDEEDLNEAKLEILQQMDSPVTPGSKAELAYEWLREGETYEIRHKYRLKILSATKEDIIRAVNEHLVKQYAAAIQVVFAGKELLAKENNLLNKPLTIKAI